MSGYGNASVSRELTETIDTLLVPGWPNQPTLEARDDGLDKVTITVPKCHKQEAWHLTVTTDGTMLVAHHTGGSPGASRRTQRTDHAMVVRVPPGRMETFRVLIKRPVSSK